MQMRGHVARLFLEEARARIIALPQKRVAPTAGGTERWQGGGPWAAGFAGGPWC
ncbi:MAG: hypothetical protein ABW048_10685 [Sphingobium sp.]